MKGAAGKTVLQYFYAFYNRICSAFQEYKYWHKASAGGTCMDSKIDAIAKMFVNGEKSAFSFMNIHISDGNIL